MKRKDLHPILPGMEIAGEVQDVCPSLPNRNFSTGDKVILFLDDDFAESGYQEYIAVDDTDKCLQIPGSIPLEVAAMLPGSALSAYSAVMKAIPHIEKLQEVKCKHTKPNLLKALKFCQFLNFIKLKYFSCTKASMLNANFLIC